MALTKIKGAGINISAAEKLYFDGGGTTYIQESADGVLDFYADNVKMLELLEGATDYVWIPVDATKFAIGAGKDLNIYTSSDDAIIENITSDKDIIFKGNDGGSTITALTLDISAAGAATFNDKIIATELDISGNMDIDGTSNLDAVDIDGAVQIDATVTVGADDQGYDVIFYGDTASSNMTWDTSADDLILNDATLSIDQDDDAHSIYIDSEATSAHTISIQAPALTTAYGISMYDMDDLTSGGGLYVHSNSSNTGSRKLLHAVNENSSATGTTVLHIQQQAGCEAVVIDQDGNSNAIYVDGENTTTPAVNIVCDVLTNGEGLRVYSNSGDNSNRNLVEIINDHASADNTRGLYIQNDGALYGIEMAGGCGIRFDSTVASADSSTLDDYEEGTITPTLLGASDPTQVYNARGGFYTKIGDRCFFSIRVEMNGSGITPGSGNCYIGGLPFTVHNDVNNYGAVNIGYTYAWLTGQHGAPTTGFLSINSTTIFLHVYDNDASNVSNSVYADAADVDDGTTITLSGHYKVA